MMSSLLINDIFTLICQEYKYYNNNIFKFQLISISNNNIIKTDNFYNAEIYVKNDEALDYIFNNYNFKNLMIDSECDANKYIDKLKKCYKLDLTQSLISNSNIKKLKKCHTLNLSFTSITDETARKLKHCYELILNGTDLWCEVIDKLKKHCKVEFTCLEDYDYDYEPDYYSTSSGCSPYYGNYDYEY